MVKCGLVVLHGPHDKKFRQNVAQAQCGVSAPQLLVHAAVGSIRKTHLWDLDKKLIKRFFDSYGQLLNKTTLELRLEMRVKRFVT